MGRAGFTTLIRWAGDIIIHPGASVVLAVLLGLDTAVLSERSELYGRFFAQPARSGVHPRWQGYAVRRADGFALVDPDSTEWSRAAWDTNGAVTVTFWRLTTRRGLWAPTRETRIRNFLFTPIDGEPGPDEWAALRRTIATEVLPPLDLIDAAESRALAEADVRIERTLWLGYLHNALACTLAGAFVLSLLWVRRVPSWIATLRYRLRARNPDRCAACGYPTAGLPHPRCPECGNPIGPDR